MDTASSDPDNNNQSRRKMPAEDEVAALDHVFNETIICLSKEDQITAKAKYTTAKQYFMASSRRGYEDQAFDEYEKLERFVADLVMATGLNRLPQDFVDLVKECRDLNRQAVEVAIQTNRPHDSHEVQRSIESLYEQGRSAFTNDDRMVYNDSVVLLISIKTYLIDLTQLQDETEGVFFNRHGVYYGFFEDASRGKHLSALFAHIADLSKDVSRAAEHQDSLDLQNEYRTTKQELDDLQLKVSENPEKVFYSLPLHWNRLAQIKNILGGNQIDLSNAVSDIAHDKNKIKESSSGNTDLPETYYWNAVSEAQTIVENADAIKVLKKGIRMNYEGGIRYLDAANTLNNPIQRVLQTSLTWYNDWCYDLYVTQEITGIKVLVQQAHELARKLAPLCRHSIGYRPENQVLSQHFLIKGFVADDPEEARQNYQEALSWNPANDNALLLFHKTVKEQLMRRLHEAKSYSQQGLFTEAYSLLDKIKGQDKEQVRQVRAAVYFQHATSLAARGEYEEAFELADEAKRNKPEDPDVWELANRIELKVKGASPFQLLGLPINAHKNEIIARSNRLSETAETDQERFQYQWAREELTSYEPSRKAHILREHARKLSLHQTTAHLLQCLFPESSDAKETLGRYRFLTDIIEQHPPFLESLQIGNDFAIKKEWAKVLKNHQTDQQFLHSLAVLYREKASEALTHDRVIEHLCVPCTALWIYLLSTVHFWDYFSKERYTEHNGTERQWLNIDHQEKLLKQSLQTTLQLHSRLGSIEFAAGRYERARIHLYCLNICRSGKEQLEEILKQYGLPYSLQLDERRFQQVSNMSADLLDDWCAAYVRDAERLVENAEAIKSLPKGIRKNYEGGIRHLEPFHDLGIPVLRVLRSSLEWYNDWCYDLYITRDIKRINALMQPACEVADRLVPFCTRSVGHRPENQVLSQHFLLRGFTEDKPEKSKRHYEEALEWNPANDNAQSLLGDAVQALLRSQLHSAVECSETNRFEEAYGILDALANQIEEKEQLTQVRAVVCFRHANTLAENGRFREALLRAKEALGLAPGHPVILEFVTEMEELAPEEENLKFLGEAQRALDNDQYDHTIHAASKVSASSKFSERALYMLSAAYFHRGINKANKNRFEDAESDLRQALQFNQKKEDRKIIVGQLEIIRQASIGYRVRQALDNDNVYKAETILRDALNEPISPDIQTDLKNQLSQVLNMHAVQLVGEIQETQKKFAEAAEDIMARVRKWQNL